MDEAIRDLVVLGGIVALCFVGALEYVYWRFGFDKIVASLHRIEGYSWETRCNTLNTVSAIQGRKVA